MGIQISTAERDSDIKSIDCSYRQWAALLILAVEFGWRPHGSISRFDNELMGYGDIAEPTYDGKYEGGGEIVIHDDARNIASALEHALKAVASASNDEVSDNTIALTQSWAMRELTTRFIGTAKTGAFSIW